MNQFTTQSSIALNEDLDEDLLALCAEANAAKADREVEEQRELSRFTSVSERVAKQTIPISFAFSPLANLRRRKLVRPSVRFFHRPEQEKEVEEEEEEQEEEQDEREQEEDIQNEQQTRFDNDVIPMDLGSDEDVATDTCLHCGGQTEMLEDYSLLCLECGKVEKDSFICGKEEPEEELEEFEPNDVEEDVQEVGGEVGKVEELENDKDDKLQKVDAVEKVQIQTAPLSDNSVFTDESSDNLDQQPIEEDQQPIGIDKEDQQPIDEVDEVEEVEEVEVDEVGLGEMGRIPRKRSRTTPSLRQNEAEVEQEKHKQRELEETVAYLRKKLHKSEKIAEKLAKKVDGMTEDFVRKNPQLNHLYTDKVQLMMGGIPCEQTDQLMRNGSYSAALMNAWVHNKWNLPQDIQVKMFTVNGTIIAPSKCIGTGRETKPGDVPGKIKKTENWVFIDVRAFPEVRYVFKSKSAMEKLSSKSGRIGKWDKIVSTK